MAGLLSFLVTAYGRVSPSVMRRWAGWATLSPVRVVALSFAAAIAVGTGLLLLPAAVASGSATSVTAALFTATSAMCLTGVFPLKWPLQLSGEFVYVSES